MMTKESRALAGSLLIILPTVMMGGGSLLSLLLTDGSGYMLNPLRQNLWRAGHAHAGVYLVLALVVLRYVDEADLSAGAKRFVRLAAPMAAIFVPAAFFLSLPKATSTQPNGFVYLAYVGAVILAAGVVTLGVGLIRAARRSGAA